MSRIENFFFLFLILFVIDNVRARLEGEGIIGGDNAEEGQYGYQVSLQVGKNNICGGCIIDDYYVITAAHCLINTMNEPRNSPLKVLAGTGYLETSSPYKVIVDVVEAFMPVEFDGSTDDYATGDIAVLKLNQSLSIKSNPRLRKLNLPDEKQKVNSIKAIVTGFGWNELYTMTDSKYQLVETGGHSYGVMRYAEVNVMSNKRCKRYMGKKKIKHLCGNLVQRNRSNHEGVCSGDSGSPLAYRDTIIGVVSTSPTGCVENKRAAVYTRVSSFANFIERAMSGTFDKDIRHLNLPVE